jgi:hypothetical protein
MRYGPRCLLSRMSDSQYWCDRVQMMKRRASNASAVPLMNVSVHPRRCGIRVTSCRITNCARAIGSCYSPVPTCFRILQMISSSKWYVSTMASLSLSLSLSLCLSLSLSLYHCNSSTIRELQCNREMHHNFMSSNRVKCIWNATELYYIAFRLERCLANAFSLTLRTRLIFLRYGAVHSCDTVPLCQSLIVLVCGR